MTWITWLTAVLCSAAVGARLGRLTVRPPSLARTSVAIATLAVTAAAAVRTPTVAALFGGAESDHTRLIFLSCWVAVAMATSLISAAAWQIRRETLLVATVGIPAVTCGVIVAMLATGNVTIGSIFIIVCGVFALTTGVRYIAWSPLGRAILYYLVGIAVVSIELARYPSQTNPTSSVWTIAILALSIGCCSVIVESWVLAQLDLSRTQSLSDMLLSAHPELVDTDYRSATSVLQADDRTSQILDGLYLHAGAGIIDFGSDGANELPAAERADAIARWLRTEESTPFDTEILATPSDFTDRRWVALIGRAYDRSS